MQSPTIIIRGAGDLATGVALRLHRAGLKKILLLETPNPLAVRRRVVFSEAIYQEEVEVEDVKASRIHQPSQAARIWADNAIPILVDPEGHSLPEIKPEILIDAIIAKRNTGTKISMAPLVIGLGPGFTAPKDVHAVIETKRGHHLGRVILNGSAAPDTGRPGNIGGYTMERVYWAKSNGVFFTQHEIGDTIAKGDILGVINDDPIHAEISGIIRGLLPTGTPVKEKTKLGDIDPRAQSNYCHLVSDKALAIGGGVLEASVAHLFSRSKQCSPSN